MTVTFSKHGDYYCFNSDSNDDKGRRRKPVRIPEKLMIKHSELIRDFNEECTDHDNYTLDLQFPCTRETLKIFAQMIKYVDCETWIPCRPKKRTWRTHVTHRAANNTSFVHGSFKYLPNITKFIVNDSDEGPYYIRSVKYTRNITYKNIDKFVELYNLCNFLICDVVMDIVLKKLYVSLFYGKRSHIPIPNYTIPYDYQQSLYGHRHMNTYIVVKSYREILEEITVPTGMKEKLIRIRDEDVSDKIQKQNSSGVKILLSELYHFLQ